MILLEGDTLWILGVNFTSHDSAAALIHNGAIVAAAEEERFNREKHTKKFPENAIKYCLQAGKIKIGDLDKIVFFNDPKLYFKLILYNLWDGFPKSFLYLPFSKKLLYQHYHMRTVFRRYFQNENLPAIEYINHHDAHAASAFYTSPFQSAAILTFDGRGEFETVTISKGVGSSIKRIYSVKFPHSIGYLYSAITVYLGFKPQSDEYIVMGLSSYGKPTLVNKFFKLAYFDKKGRFKLNLNYFDHYYRYGKRRKYITEKFIKEFGPPRSINEKITQKHADIAFALQNLTERIILNFVSLSKELTGEESLCIAGGVALNCVANARILKSKIFKNVFIQPAANDAGTSIGAALYSYYKKFQDKPHIPLDNMYLGPSYSNKQTKEALENFGTHLYYTYIKDPSNVAAELIHDKWIVGWFQGRMEFGPRALGNRSILATPARREMKCMVNDKIKFREEFRPFAPAILVKHTNKFFNEIPNGKNMYPFMLATLDAKRSAYKKIPAVLHVDNTARIQTVKRRTNPKFWKLIHDYYKISGLPLILNTSFNVKGEPIVCTVSDALRTLQKSGLDIIIVNNYLISKNSKIIERYSKR